MQSWLVVAVASAGLAQNVSIPLQAAAGTAFRVYATSRVPMKLGAPVSAKLIDPVFSFDRVVIPSGSEVRWSVLKLDPAPRLMRFHALLSGDFTPSSLCPRRVHCVSPARRPGASDPHRIFSRIDRHLPGTQTATEAAKAAAQALAVRRPHSNPARPPVGSPASQSTNRRPVERAHFWPGQPDSRTK
jgi:hypothetical protein